MEVTLTHNDVDITDYVISYERNHDICTGIGNIRVELPNITPRDFIPWDRIVIYENTFKVATYYISNVVKDAKNGVTTLDCQDNSKKLTDYFIDDIYYIDYPSYTRYWIEKFLTEVGITYNFYTDSNGSLLNNDTSLGMTQAYDLVLDLLRMSGWYIRFNKDGIALIGTLDLNTEIVEATITDSRILSLITNKNDSALRNRAVVWGKGDIETNQWIFADISTHTPYNFDLNDKRAVVYANSYIDNTGTAYSLAHTLLNEFAQITYIKRAEIEGTFNIGVGSAVRLLTSFYTGTCLLTSYTIIFSKDGLRSIYNLDERCSRLLGYFGWDGYVYVGTSGAGVWKKPIEGDNWSPDWDNLGDMFVTDLIINNGVFACVGQDGSLSYRRFPGESWKHFNKGFISISGLDDHEEKVKAVACTINRVDNKIIAGFNIEVYEDDEIYVEEDFLFAGSNIGYVAEINPFNGYVISGDVVYIPSGEFDIQENDSIYNLTVVDLDTNDTENIVSVRRKLDEFYYGLGYTGYDGDLGDFTIQGTYISGTSNIRKVPMIDNRSHSVHPAYGATGIPMVMTHDKGNDTSSPYVVGDKEVWICLRDSLIKFDIRTFTKTVYNFGEILGEFKVKTSYYIRKKDENNFSIVTFWEDGSGDDLRYYIKHFNFELSTETLEPQSSNWISIATGEIPYGIVGTALIDDYFYVYYYKAVIGESSGKFHGVSLDLADNDFNDTILTSYYEGSFGSPPIEHKVEFSCAFVGEKSFCGVAWTTVNSTWSDTSPYARADANIFVGTYGNFSGGSINIDEWNDIPSGITIFEYKGKPTSSSSNVNGKAYTRYGIFVHTWETDVGFAEKGQRMWVVELPTGNKGSERNWMVDSPSGVHWDNLGRDLVYTTEGSTLISWQPTQYFTSKTGFPIIITHDKYIIDLDDLGQVGQKNNSITTSISQINDLDGAIHYVGNYEGQLQLVDFNLEGSIVKSLPIPSDFGNSNRTFLIRNFLIRCSSTSLAVMSFGEDDYYNSLKDNNFILRQEEKEFFVVSKPNRSQKVEISKHTPTVLHAVLSGDIASSVIRSSFTNLYGSFNPVSVAGEDGVHDVRVFDVTTSGTFIPYSGEIPSGFDRFIGYAAVSGIYMISSSLEGEESTIDVPTSFSDPNWNGVVNKLETSNYTIEPHIFYSVSGVTTYNFWQKLDDENYFVSYEFPRAEPITIIRLDDRI